MTPANVFSSSRLPESGKEPTSHVWLQKTPAKWNLSKYAKKCSNVTPLWRIIGKSTNQTLSNGISRWWEVNTENSLFLSPTRAWSGPKLYPHRPDQQRWRIQTLCRHQGEREGERERGIEGVLMTQKLMLTCNDTLWAGRNHGGQINFQLQRRSRACRSPHLERLVTGSRITIHSFTSPYLQKYSFRPSGEQNRKMKRQYMTFTRIDNFTGRGFGFWFNFFTLLRFPAPKLMHLSKT